MFGAKSKTTTPQSAAVATIDAPIDDTADRAELEQLLRERRQQQRQQAEAEADEHRRNRPVMDADTLTLINARQSQIVDEDAPQEVAKQIQRAAAAVLAEHDQAVKDGRTGAAIQMRNCLCAMRDVMIGGQQGPGKIALFGSGLKDKVVAAAFQGRGEHCRRLTGGAFGG